MFSHHRLEGESARAFAAFCLYRDLGPGRSLRAAWQKHNANRGAPEPEAKCAGHWQRWSVQWHWVERACQFDIELDAVKRETFTGRLRALEQERAEREIDNQAILWRSVQDIGAILEKANAAPITDITQLKQEVVGDKLVKNTNKVKGLSMAGYARLVAVRNETARQAIVGVREKPAAVEDARVVERVVLKTGRKG